MQVLKINLRQMKYLILIFVALFGSLVASAQMPQTNVYLFEIEQVTDSAFMFKEPKFLTAFNHTGYNNQPVFLSESELYLTVRLSTDTSQTDIYAFDIANEYKTRVTSTPESEYSPTLTPDGQHFSVVRVGADKKQRLWQYPLNRSGEGRGIMPSLDMVGYHFWINAQKLAVFVVDSPNYLAVVDLYEPSVTRLMSDVGRCFQRLPNGNMAFVYKATDQTWFIEELDVRTLSAKIIVPALSGREDFVVLPEGTFLMGKGSQLFKYHPAFDKDWIQVADFRLYGIKNIMRLAVSPAGKLAMVTSN
jgi:hypothetical protein